MSLGLISGKLIKAGADYAIDTSNADLEYIGLYFSAHWCPPCRGFTPKLAEYYNKVNKNKLRFEVVFVSSDQDEDQFKDYFGEMPWAALKYDERDTKGSLSQTYSIRGIPTLVVLDKKGQTVNANGRGCVMNEVDKANPDLKWA